MDNETQHELISNDPRHERCPFCSQLLPVGQYGLYDHCDPRPPGGTYMLMLARVSDVRIKYSIVTSSGDLHGK